MAPQKFRVIAHLDVDCFELQVRGKQNSISCDDLLRIPAFAELAEGNFITSTNHLAKNNGIERGPINKAANRNRYASAGCLKIPNKYGKQENLSLRITGEDIYQRIVLALRSYANDISFGENFKYFPLVEKCNSDGFFVDLTYLVRQRRDDEELDLGYLLKRMKGIRGFRVDLKRFTFESNQYPKGYRSLLVEAGNDTNLFALLKGADIICYVLDELKKKLGFVVSAGVSENKLLAKLACHRSKPNGIAVLPYSNLERVQRKMSFTKLPGLGSTSGEDIKENFQSIQTIKDFKVALSRKPFWKWLSKKKDPQEFLKKCKGLDNTPVVPTCLSSKVLCGKSLNSSFCNQIYSKDNFLTDLRERFCEMRDNLLYDLCRNGRLPKTLKLEIFQKGLQRDAIGKTLFRESIEYDESYLSTGYDEAILKFDCDNEDLSDWQPVLGIFKSKINEKVPLLFLSGGSFNYKSLCKINLIAYF